MSLGQRYSAGFMAVLLATSSVALLLSEPDRRGVLTALAIVAAVQVPLGWWLIRSVGRPAALAAWIIGMLVRFGVVVLAGLVLVPRLGWPAAPTLIGMVVVVLALLLVESTVLWLEHFGSGAT